MAFNAEEMFELYSHVVYRYLYSLCHDPALCEDLLQNTFLQALKHSQSFQEKSSPSTWLCAIARNEWKKYCRKNPILLPLEENVPSSTSHPETSLADGQLLQMIHRQPEPFREILYLRLFGNLPFSQIGQIFGRPESWARVTFFRARQKIRKEIAEDENHE